MDDLSKEFRAVLERDRSRYEDYLAHYRAQNFTDDRVIIFFQMAPAAQQLELKGLYLALSKTVQEKDQIRRRMALIILGRLAFGAIAFLEAVFIFFHFYFHH